jgi:hypothetical protein
LFYDNNRGIYINIDYIIMEQIKYTVRWIYMRFKMSPQALQV